MSHYSLQEKDYSSLDKNIKIVIVSTEWNRNYTLQMEEINQKFLEKNGFHNITKYMVPGAYEIPYMVKTIINTYAPDLIIALGVVIRWETTHYDMVAGESARGLTNIALQKDNKTAIINGILTCENTQQVEARINDNYALSGLNYLSELFKI